MDQHNSIYNDPVWKARFQSYQRITLPERGASTKSTSLYQNQNRGCTQAAVVRFIDQDGKPVDFYSNETLRVEFAVEGGVDFPRLKIILKPRGRDMSWSTITEAVFRPWSDKPHLSPNL
ncbi:MAG: hypothetical protein Q9222_000998 [Ikaeria aurantiellina]